MQKRTVLFGLGLVASITALAYASDALDELSASNGRADAPIFEVDPFWPQPLPNHWVLGSAVGVGVDSRDHVYIIHRQAPLSPSTSRTVTRSLSRTRSTPPATRLPVSSARAMLSREMSVPRYRAMPFRDTTLNPGTRDSLSMSPSVRPAATYSSDPSGLRSSKYRTAMLLGARTPFLRDHGGSSTIDEPNRDQGHRRHAGQGPLLERLDLLRSLFAMEPCHDDNSGSQRQDEHQSQLVDQLRQDLIPDQVIENLQHDPTARKVRRSEVRHTAGPARTRWSAGSIP